LGWWLFSKDKLKEAFKGMLALIGWLLRRLCELEGRIKELEQLRHRLEGRLALNSTNSGKLPLTDGLAKAARKSLRTKSGRRPGGQPGHPGRTLQPVARPDHTLAHRLDHCSCGQCGGGFVAGGAGAGL
jgi:hypothetical protein